MKISDALKVSVEALIANKLRACLTMLGLIIGIGAVISLMALGQGSQKAVSDKIAGLGSNLLFIEPGSLSNGGVQAGLGTARTLTISDGDAIYASVPQVANAVSEIRVPSQVSANGTNTLARINGVSADYANVLQFKMANGDFFSSIDVDEAKSVAVLGAKIAQTLFKDREPVGQTFRLGLGPRNYVSMEVVGVLEPTGGSTANRQDNFIYVPMGFAIRRLPSSERTSLERTRASSITVQVLNKDAIDQAKQDIRALLLDRHKVAAPDFALTSQEDIAATANAVNKSLTVLLGAIAGISLVVGGIGIMNIMLVSVTERTREIGIRKAVGARYVDIMMQFLTEAVTVTFAGGALGIIAGVGVAELLNGSSIGGIGNNVQTIISWTSVVAAFAVSGLIGVFFGLYPAQRAASMKPIDALRYE